MVLSVVTSVHILYSVCTRTHMQTYFYFVCFVFDILCALVSLYRKWVRETPVLNLGWLHKKAVASLSVRRLLYQTK